MSFKEIVRYVPIKDMIALYNPYHEMDIHQFIDKVNAMYKAVKPETSCQGLFNQIHKKATILWFYRL